MSIAWITRVFAASVFATTSVLALQSQLQSHNERSNQQESLPSADKVKVKDDSWVQLAALGAQLDKRLTEEQSKSKSAIVTQQAVYAHKVSEQRAMNEQTETENEIFKDRIIAVQTSSKSLRAEAATRVKACENVREYINEVRGNISLAMDFLDGAINESGDMLGKGAPELVVLRQLKAEEEHEKREKQRQIPAAMLQTAAGSNPQQLLQSMVASLEAVTKERNISLMSLKTKFAAEIEKLNLTSAALLEEHARLNATLNKEMHRNAALEESIGHLQATYDQLQAHSKALRLFAQRLGINTKLAASDHDDEHGVAASDATAKTKAGVVSPAMLLSKKKAKDLVDRAEKTAKAHSEMAKRDGTSTSQAAALKAEQALSKARALASKLGGN